MAQRRIRRCGRLTWPFLQEFGIHCFEKLPDRFATIFDDATLTFGYMSLRDSVLRVSLIGEYELA